MSAWVSRRAARNREARQGSINCPARTLDHYGSVNDQALRPCVAA